MWGVKPRRTTGRAAEVACWWLSKGVPYCTRPLLGALVQALKPWQGQGQRRSGGRMLAASHLGTCKPFHTPLPSPAPATPTRTHSSTHP